MLCCYFTHIHTHSVASHNFNLYEAYNVRFLVTLSDTCKFNHIFITEVIVKDGVLLDYITPRAVSTLSSLFTYTRESEYPTPDALNITCIINLDFMAETLCCISLDCTGVPHKVDTECIHTSFILLSKYENLFNDNTQHNTYKTTAVMFDMFVVL